MNAKEYALSANLIIEKLDLEDFQKEIIKTEWLGFINYLEYLTKISQDGFLF